MNTVTILWSAVAGGCLMMAGMHLLVWLRKISAWENFFYPLTVLAAVGFAAGELVSMQTRSPEVYAATLRWMHIANLVATAGALGFIHFYFGTGRRRLLELALGLRLLATMVNFATGEGLQLHSIHSLHQVEFLGETVSVPGEWVPGRWAILGQLSSVLLVVYIADAAIRLWRQGSPDGRRRAVVAGGGLAFFIVIATGQVALVASGAVRMPFLASISFLGMVGAMGYELSRDVLRSMRLSKDLDLTEQRLAQAAAAAHLALWEWDIGTDRLWISAGGQLLHGVEQHGMIDFGRFVATVHPDDFPAVTRAVEAALAGSRPFAVDYRVRLPDGSHRWIAASGQVERDGQGRATLLRGISMDVTERHQTQVELRQSEDFKKAILDAVAAHIAVLDSRGVIVAVNARWQRFAKDNPPESGAPDDATGVGANYLEVCRNADFDGSAMMAHDGIRAVLDGRLQSFSLEYPCHPPDQQRWFSMNVTSMGEGDGERSAVVAHVDITERKQAEERFRQVIEAAPNAMVMIDAAGRITLVNAQAEAVFGYSRDEMLGASIETLIPERFHGLHPGLREGYHGHPTDRAMGAGRELFGRRKDGSEVPVEIGLNPIRTQGETFVLASIIDISGRRQAALESSRQQEELAHLSRISILGELAGALAHELNQPLAAILGNSQVGGRMLREPAPDFGEIAHILDDVAEDAKRAGAIIHGMRAMFKKDPVREPQPVDLNEMIAQVLSLLHSEIVSRKVKVDLFLAGGLPPAAAGRVEVQQVVMNLVLNGLDALKGMADGLLSVTTARQGDQVVVTVHDSGPGIAPEMMDRLFDPFVSTKHGGLGLGLAISLSIAERFHGKLLAENDPRGGATFRLALPVASG